MFHAEPRGEFFFKRLAFGTKDIVAAVDNFENPAVNRFALMNTGKRNLRGQTASLRKVHIRRKTGAGGKYRVPNRAVESQRAHTEDAGLTTKSRRHSAWPRCASATTKCRNTKALAFSIK